MGGFAQRTNVHQRTRQKGADIADIDRKATLDLTVDDANNDFALFAGFFQLFPAFSATRFFAGQACFTEAVVYHLHRNLNPVAYAQCANAFFVEKLIFRDNPFGLQSGVNDNPVVVNIYHRAGYDGSGRHLDGV